MLKKMIRTSKFSALLELPSRRGMRIVAIDTDHRFIPKQFRAVHGQRISTFGPDSTSHKLGELGAIAGRRDVTECQHTELALKEQLRLQDQLVKVAATVPGVIFSFRLRPDGSAHMPYANQVFESLCGLSPDVVAKDFGPVLARIHPDDIAHIHETIAESALALQPWQGSFRYHHPSKGEIWLEGHSMPIREMDGSTLWHGYMQDITSRKQMEIALQASEERMHLATQATGVGIWEWNIITGKIRWDAQMFKIYGIAPTQDGFVQYKTWCECVLPEDLPQQEEALQDTVRRLGQSFREFRIRKAGDSDCRHIQAVETIRTNALGQAEWVVGTNLDITERKCAEAALHNVQARLALVVEEVNAGYWDWNMMTRTLYVSPEWKRQIGFDEDELTHGWEQKEERLHPNDKTLVKTATEDFIAGRLPVYELQFRLRHKDGTYRWIHSRAALLRDQNNQPYRMLGINLDITDYMRTKELNERREQMEQSCRLYVASQTAAAIAHELNQPLTAIFYYADAALLMLQSGNQNPQKLSHILENCTLQAQRAGEVIRQLTTLLHRGEATNSEPSDINLTIQEALDYVKTDVHLGTFRIEHDLTTDLPPVSANHLQIQKVLITLIRNGLESMQESGINAGTMTVTTRRLDGTPAMALVTVCDNGKGVADIATLKTMFKPFHTTKASGLGMGLAISRALIEAHGGKIWAEQNADVGISIHLTLPFAT